MRISKSYGILRSGGERFGRSEWHHRGVCGVSAILDFCICDGMFEYQNQHANINLHILLYVESNLYHAVGSNHPLSIFMDVVTIT